ncbi:MAG: D-glycero-beta-D-manno-heptose 1,7-bisphosphate 7-phosphatase [bacterium]|nr:D-glycero-beta-D-manno-heptose 1,7-bisphosphate 7-phosphatase [Planctomycetota bacterium]HIL53368.1 D-glycero-beta-D-manno-heptose 1,7-bisphosphate 7-phosphatase [Planctomycetota bacterium]
MNTGVPRRAAFLDRDGTINLEVDYLSDPAELCLIPGSAAAIAQLNRADWCVVVVTNQSGIARGKLTEVDLTAIHRRLDELLAAEGAHIDAYYHCPHHPEFGASGACTCRKPEPGLFLRAAEELSLDLSRSWTIGDSLRDLEAGVRAGTGGVLVRTGKSAALPSESPTSYSAADLAAAVASLV